MLCEIDNKCLILLIWINVFYETRVSFEFIHVLCKRDFSWSLSKWVNETCRADSSPHGLFISSHYEISPGIVASQGRCWNLLFNMDEGTARTTFIQVHKNESVAYIEAN